MRFHPKVGHLQPGVHLHLAHGSLSLSPQAVEVCKGVLNYQASTSATGLSSPKTIKMAEGLNASKSSYLGVEGHIWVSTHL